MKVLLTAGTFDLNGGKKSGLIEKMYLKLKEYTNYYIVHSHCYIKSGFFTSVPVPCGALDEIDEVLKVIKQYYKNNFTLDYYKVNLKGHRCLILGKEIEDLKITEYIARNLPEKLWEE